mgnify:CR=1 FL=1|jgi:hypothetical protein|nr:MAG TPA: hypothetical protein [Bacteriophage sp.]
MATFNIKHSNQSILDYMREKITVEYNGSVEDVDGGIKVEVDDNHLKDITDAFSRAKRNAMFSGWVKSATKFVGRQADTVKDVGIGAVGISAKGIFGGLKKTAEVAMGATAVIVNEGKEAWKEASVSDELRNLKKSFGSTGNDTEGIEIIKEDTVENTAGERA